MRGPPGCIRRPQAEISGESGDSGSECLVVNERSVQMDATSCIHTVGYALGAPLGSASAAAGADLAVGDLVGEQGANLGGLGGVAMTAAHRLDGHTGVDQLGGTKPPSWRERTLRRPITISAAPLQVP